MAKKYFQKALSVGLSLALCATMTAPAFAASFQDLQNAIGSGTGANLGNGYTGYGANASNTDGMGYDIWAKNDGETREIQLKGNVDSDPVNTSDPNTIYVSSGKVSIDLNGHDINGKEQGGAVIEVSGGATLTLDDHSNDRNPNADVGKITGGTGSGIFVGKDGTAGTLIMNDGEISKNTANSGSHGGGVHVNNADSSFTMNGGKIIDNSADQQGGGVFVQKGTFTMTGGEISGNTANYGGGVNTIGGTVEMKNGTIGNNTAGEDGSDVWVKAEGSNTASFTMSGNSTINGSNADGKHTVAVEGNSTFTMSGNATVRSSDSAAADILAKNGSTVNYNRGDNGGFRDVNAGDDNAELQKKVVSTKDTGLNIEYPATPAGGAGGTGEVTIDEPAVPLAAGPVTRAEFIDYLWRHEGEPESAGVCTFTDVAEEHEYFAALCWAEENGIAEAYLNDAPHVDGTFEPDELVTVAAVREFLGNFARVFGMDVDVYALTTLTGEDDEAVLNCDEVLAEFFGEELQAAA